jgi:diaminohydroxyphosphoribosylaminopyrimidine deaminase / 5-amino-6-(5-phosphoribosylamino)uracil reductase
MALAQAGEKSRGATCYVSLEPCAHTSPRGPACSDLLIAAGVTRVVIAVGDPDPRTDGGGVARLRASGIAVVENAAPDLAREAMAGFLTRQARGRPFVTLKLATSLDGRIALASGESRWITGPEARAHAHLERARHEAILVGGRTQEVDGPKLDVRLPGLAERSPRRLILSRNGDLKAPGDIAQLDGVDHLLVEGGAETAAAFLREHLVDRLLLYRAPILIGEGKAALGDIGLAALADAHGRWQLTDARQLGSDRLEVYASR